MVCYRWPATGQCLLQAVGILNSDALKYRLDLHVRYRETVGQKPLRAGASKQLG
jgi:hypothetical protein